MRAPNGVQDMGVFHPRPPKEFTFIEKLRFSGFRRVLNMRLDQRKIGIGRGVYLGWKFVGADTVYDCVSECLVCPEMHSQKIVVTFASWKLILLCTCLLAEAFLTLGLPFLSTFRE